MGLKRRGVNGQLAASAGALVTAGANVSIQPTKLILFGEEADTNIRLFILRSGDSAGDTTEIDRIPSIAHNERVDIGMAGVALYDGDSIQGQSDNANRINWDLSYIEITGE